MKPIFKEVFHFFILFPFLCIQSLPFQGFNFSTSILFPQVNTLGYLLFSQLSLQLWDLRGVNYLQSWGWERNRHRIATLHRFLCIHYPSFLLPNETYVNIWRERGANQQLLKGAGQSFNLRSRCYLLRGLVRWLILETKTREITHGKQHWQFTVMPVPVERPQQAQGTPVLVRSTELWNPVQF